MSLGCLWCIKAQSSAVWYAWVLWVANIPRACVVNVKTVKLTLFKRFLTDVSAKPPSSIAHREWAMVEIKQPTMSRKKIIVWSTSLRSKRFQSSYCAKVRAEAKKKKVEGGGGEEKRKRLPANPTILKNAPWYFTVGFVCKLTLLAPHQSEAAFVGERSFSKSWGLRARGSFFLLPLPRHSFFCSLLNFLDELARKRLLRRLLVHQSLDFVFFS